MRILIVEDQPKMAELLRKGLEEEACSVVTATDGEEGLAAAQSCDLDAIVLDVMLPGIDGFEVVEVRDSGMGISKQDLPHIFDRFYWADRARNCAQAGSGLGLAIARRIAELHKGIIRAESEEGRGSLCTVYLPVIEHASGKDPQQPMPTTER